VEARPRKPSLEQNSRSHHFPAARIAPGAPYR